MNYKMVSSVLWRRILLATLAIVCASTSAAENEPAVDQAAVIAPFVNDDTFAVGYLDLALVDAADESNGLNRLLEQMPQTAQSDPLVLQTLGNAAKGLHAAGADGVYAVLGLGDIYENGGPLVVITVANDRDPAAVEATLQGFSQMASATHSKMPKFPVRRQGTQTILVGSELTIARYESLHAAQRGDLTEPLEKMTADGAAVAAVVSPGPDFRRVVRELWPEFPGPLAQWKGELADRWLRLEFAAKSSPPASLAAELVMQSTDAASAKLFAQLLHALPNASEQFTEIGNKRHDLKRYLQAIVEAVPPEVDGTRVVMQLPTDESRLAKLKGLMKDATGAALESTRRRQRMDQFKQMAFAMHNYADINKHLAPPAIHDANGRPLLSWRVAILPYLEQDNLYALYAQFHLDEPWDSPHNLTLVKFFPSNYSDPAHPELAREGKTTYVVPVGPGTVFDTKDGIAFREITDGSSKTIMIVEVPPENAVIWTKPEDWEVDMAHPLRGLERTDRDYFVGAWCDGSGRAMPTDVKSDVLRANLTRAGGELVDRP
ncbi:MAG: DUF1559 domain-containing protein [Pirellulales bacterium]